jgi:hypothetical protein
VVSGRQLKLNSSVIEKFVVSVSGKSSVAVADVWAKKKGRSVIVRAHIGILRVPIVFRVLKEAEL